MARQKLFPRRRPRRSSVLERTVGVFLLLLLAGILALVASGGAGAGPPGLPAPPEAAGGAGAALPLRSPAGWPRGEVEAYDRESVFEKIDGKADIYLDYGFAKLLFASYADPAEPSRYADVYVYDMEEARNAFGIYRAQRSGTAAEIPGGDEACAAGAGVFARAGRYQIEILGSDLTAAEEVRALLGPVVTALGPGKGITEPPWFPEEGRTAVRYERQKALGTSVLADCFVAVYEDGAKAFVARFEDGEAAGAAAESAREEFEFLATPAEIEVIGRRVVGAIEGPDEARRKALLETVRRRTAEKEER